MRKKITLEDILVTEVKPIQLIGSNNYRYYLQCPHCERGLVIRNKKTNAYIQKIKKQEISIEFLETRKGIEKIIGFLENKAKELKENKL